MLEIMRVILTLYFIGLLFYIVSCAVEKSGPYKTTLLGTGPCKKPTLPLDKEPTFLFYAEAYNTTNKVNLMRGNATILRDTRNKRIKAKGYYWEDGEWKAHYIMNNMGCHSIILPVITAAAGVKYDRKNCNFLKGRYKFSGVDTNKIQHMWMQKQEYGRVKWVNELMSDTGSVVCWEYEMVVEPAM